jgi:hypothetical protein
MAVSSGVGQHAAWLTVNGATFPLESGSVEQSKTRSSSTFHGELPLGYPGALAALGGLGENSAAVTVLCRGAAVPLIVGEVDSVVAKFGDAGLISVSGRCKSAKLHQKKTSDKWINRKPGEIVQELASKAGLSVQADPGLMKAGKFVNIDWTKITNGIPLAAAIHKLAEMDGAKWWCDKTGTLHYSYAGATGGVYTVSYSPGPPITADFLSLTATRNVQAAKGAKVTVKSWHPKDKKVNKGEASAGGGGLEYEYQLPNLKPEQAQQHAKSKAKEHARHAVTISAHVVGDPAIDVAMTLAVMGTGAFDGGYEIDAIHHNFGMGGYTMEITAKTAESGE